MLLALFLLASYCIGAISTAIIVCSFLGLPDPRESGSRNPGATNVLRIGGKKAALLTLIGDALKGFVPTVVATGLGLSPVAILLVMVAAILGHMYPVFFRFQGGKGVATLFGGLWGFSQMSAIAWLIIWLATALITRYSSLSALLATAALPFVAWFQFHDVKVVLLLVLLFALIAYRHRSNVAHLLRGEEKKIGYKDV